MKRRDLIKAIEVMAMRDGHSVEMREGSNHTVVKVGSRRTTIPRHREINELTARSILKKLFG